jgi:hypothetical protein
VKKFAQAIPVRCDIRTLEANENLVSLVDHDGATSMFGVHHDNEHVFAGFVDLDGDDFRIIGRAELIPAKVDQLFAFLGVDAY